MNYNFALQPLSRMLARRALFSPFKIVYNSGIMLLKYALLEQLERLQLVASYSPPPADPASIVSSSPGQNISQRCTRHPQLSAAEMEDFYIFKLPRMFSPTVEGGNVPSGSNTICVCRNKKTKKQNQVKT